MARYFYSSAGRTQGPVSPREIMQLILDDTLSTESSVQDTRSPRWVKIADIPELMRYLHVSEVSLAPTDEEIAELGTLGEHESLFYHIPMRSLTWLSILTLGWFGIYWLYRNWVYLRYHYKRKTAKNFFRDLINPLALANIFSLISLDKDLTSREEERDMAGMGWLWMLSLLALFVFTSGVLAYLLRYPRVLDIPATLLVLGLSVLCLKPVQKLVNAANARHKRDYSSRTFGFYAILLLGILGWVYVLATWLPPLFKLLNP